MAWPLQGGVFDRWQFRTAEWLSAVEVGNETRKAIQVDISSLRTFSEQTANNIEEMRDIQYQGLEQLQAINKNTYNLFAMKDDLADLKKIAKDYWK